MPGNSSARRSLRALSLRSRGRRITSKRWRPRAATPAFAITASRVALYAAPPGCAGMACASSQVPSRNFTWWRHPGCRMPRSIRAMARCGPSSCPRRSIARVTTPLLQTTACCSWQSSPRISTAGCTSANPARSSAGHSVLRVASAPPAPRSTTARGSYVRARGPCGSNREALPRLSPPPARPLFSEQGGVAALHLLGRHTLEMPAPQPLVSERVAYRARALTVELVLERFEHARTGLYRARKCRIHVRYVQVHQESSTAERARSAYALLGVLIREHERRRPDPDLGVADAPARLGQAEQFLGAEGGLI